MTDRPTFTHVETKTCATCCAEKPLAAFHKQGARRHSYCADCYNARYRGAARQLPHLTSAQGVNRKLFIEGWFKALSDRLREVRVACGDWSRVTGPSVIGCGGGVCGVFLDPPYALDERAEVYSVESAAASECLAWCLENGDNPALRIVLAGYAGEHDALEASGWRVKAWKARGGYGGQGEGRGRDNAARERLWLSPHCIGAARDLFSEGAAA